MPRIPTLEAPSVAPSITPGARFDAPQMGSPAAEQAQRSGQAISAAGDALQNLQIEFTKPIVREAMNSAVNIGMEFETGDGGFIHLKGKDAVGREVPLDVEYANAYRDRLNEIKDKLPNQMAKDAFSADAATLVQRFGQRVTSHMVREQGAYQQSQLEGQAATGSRLMAERFDSPEEWANGRNAVLEAVSEANKGMAPEYVTEKARAMLSPTHAVIVSQMLGAGQAQAAQDYFAKVSDDLTSEAKVKLSAAIATSATEIEGQQAAREVIAGAGADWTLRDIDQKLVERFGSNPKALNEARQEAKYQRDLMDSAKRETEAQLLGPIQSAVADARLNGRNVDKNALAKQLGLMRVTRPDLYEKASSIIDAHNDELRNERQAADERMRGLSNRSAEENAVAIKWDMVLNPDKYRNADMRTQLADLTGSKAIKPAGAAELLKLWQGIRDPSKGGNLKTMSTLAQYMDARLQGVMTGSPSDLKPFSGLGKPAQDAIRAKARAAIDRVMIDRQMSGQGISDKDARDIIDSMFVNTSIRSSFLGFSGASVPATKLDMTIGIPQAAIDFLKSNNTPQTRLEFDQKYGVGMAAAVTGK